MSAQPTDLKALIAAEAKANLMGRVMGHDWFQLSDAEQLVFDIAYEDMPLMVCAWEAFQAFHGMVGGTVWDMQHQAVVDAAKTARPDLVEQGFTAAGWTAFAVTYSSLTMREAWKWYAKNDAWLQRDGVLQFEDGSQG